MDRLVDSVQSGNFSVVGHGQDSNASKGWGKERETVGEELETDADGCFQGRERAQVEIPKELVSSSHQPTRLNSSYPPTMPSSHRSQSNSPSPEDDFSESDQPVASSSKLVQPASANAAAGGSAGAGKGKGKAGEQGEEKIKRKSGKKGKKFVEEKVRLSQSSTSRSLTLKVRSLTNVVMVMSM
jgi:hypothetical protein